MKFTRMIYAGALALLLLAVVSGCLEERVISDNSVDAKLGRSTPAGTVDHPNARPRRNWDAENANSPDDRTNFRVNW